jgi:hypothetical protein
MGLVFKESYAMMWKEQTFWHDPEASGSVQNWRVYGICAMFMNVGNSLNAVTGTEVVDRQYFEFEKE